MPGLRLIDQSVLFYQFLLEVVSCRSYAALVDRFMDLSDVCRELAGFYSLMGRSAVDPELIIRMLVGYCFGIHLQRRLCKEVHVNLTYRWCGQCRRCLLRPYRQLYDQSRSCDHL